MRSTKVKYAGYEGQISRVRGSNIQGTRVNYLGYEGQLSGVRGSTIWGTRVKYPSTIRGTRVEQKILPSVKTGGAFKSIATCPPSNVRSSAEHI